MPREKKHPKDHPDRPDTAELAGAAKQAAPEKDTGKEEASREQPAEQRPPDEMLFPIVGIGASAGGLEAFQQLLDNLPSDTGMAFVLVQHLAPGHKSILAELLSGSTRMPVTQVEQEGTAVQANHVYVIAPNTVMTISNRVLKLLPRTVPHTIDVFFNSLAEDVKDKAIGVVLSGAATDGSLGIREIKAAGGITFAQDPDTAKYPDMPRSAVATRQIDFVLPPDRIAQELEAISRHPYSRAVAPERIMEPWPEGTADLSKIFIILRRATAVDFSHYKHTTINRRILRRMAVHRMENLSEYVKVLQRDNEEVNSLFDDLLITVTGFFRDAESFDRLREVVFPRIMEDKTPETPIRVWVPGCSTGEEAYSIAISLLEFLDDQPFRPPIKIFASDINEKAIEIARTGKYPENITTDVSPERLRRFFVRMEARGGYQINKDVRDLCVFARQDLTKDPPFSRLDLISCRNVLIYMDSELQRLIIPVLHYALKSPGFLFLGPSETVAGFSELFGEADKKCRMFYRKDVPAHMPAGFPSPAPLEGLRVPMAQGRPREEGKAPEPEEAALRKEIERIFDRHGPAVFVVDDDLSIVEFRGNTRPWLEPSRGQASLHLFRMIRDTLATELRSLMHRVRETNEPGRRAGLRIACNGRTVSVGIEIVPVRTTDGRRLVIAVEGEAPAAEEERESGGTRAKHGGDDEALHKELDDMKAHLESVIQDQEATNEEFRAANEEIQSANEELQSTNEELETAKEELQSTNEELATVNDELEKKNRELRDMNNDLVNLLSSVQIPIVMLGNDLRIRRFTPAAEKIMSVIPSDIGRPISDMNLKIELPNLAELLHDVIDTLSTKETETQSRDGRWYLIRIRPYKTAENRIEGAVLTLIDIDATKRLSAQLSVALQVARGIIGASREQLMVLDSELTVQAATEQFYRAFNLAKEETEGKLLGQIGKGQWASDVLNQMLAKVTTELHPVERFRMTSDFDDLGRLTMVLSAYPLLAEGGGPPHLMLMRIEGIQKAG